MLCVIFDLVGGEFIAAIIFFIIAVTFYFDPGNLMFLLQSDEFFPQITVEDRLFFTVFPAVFLPVYGPFLQETVDQIGAVAVEFYDAGLFEQGQ